MTARVGSGRGSAGSGFPDLARRFGDHLEEMGAPRPGDGAVVAVSGGVDSLVLLHLLRFASALPVTDLVAAHLDHGMRPTSSRDAAWLRGLLEAWRVKGRFEEVHEPPADEAEARAARYAFLDRVRGETGASWILTAHHADDQAETVLFRIVRGSGLRGLRGIPPRRDPGILRPLLGFWKAEIRAYARAVGIRPRIDESNLDRRFARNVLRHDVLPTLESEVAPGARRALVRLSRLARQQEEAWESVEEELLKEIVVSGTPGVSGVVLLDRSAILSRHPAVRARILRRVLRDVGVRLDEAGTRDALAFTSEGTSGARWSLPGGWVLRREFDHLVIAPAEEDEPAHETLEIHRPASGDGELRVGGRCLRAWWSPSRKLRDTPTPSAGPVVAEPGDPDPRNAWTEEFSSAALVFPLRLRGWVPGDRIRLRVGSKKLKKLFGERRVPIRERHRRPVLSDAEDRVLWVPGLARSTLALPEEGGDVFVVGVIDVGDG